MRPNARPARYSPRIAAVAAALAGVFFGLPVLADEADAVKFLIGETVTHDDNVFRLSDSATISPGSIVRSRSDTIYTTYGGAIFDKTYSRQRLYASAVMNINRYQDNSALNNNGLLFNGLWGWELGNRLKGKVTYDRTRQLIDFGGLGGADRGHERDVNTYQRFGASADWWFHPEYSYGAAYAHFTSRYDSELRQASEYNADSYELTAKFQPRTGNLIGLAARKTRGEYPNREVVVNSLAPVDNGYDQMDYEVNGDWHLTGQSRVSGRLGYTTRRHDQVEQRDFSGVTGRLAYDWALEGKTSINVALRREIGAVDDVTASYVVTEGVSIMPVWYPTSKTSLSARYDWRKLDYRGDPTGFLTGFPEARKDKVRTAGLTGSYLPLRNLQLSLRVQREKRSSNQNGNDYDDNLASLSAQFSF